MRAEPVLPGFSQLFPVFLYIVLISFYLPATTGLYVVSGSNCTSACYSNSTGSGYTTRAQDVRCYDSDYSTSAAGIGFQDCVACEFEIPTFEHATTQTDIGWALCKWSTMKTEFGRFGFTYTIISQYQIYSGFVFVPVFGEWDVEQHHHEYDVSMRQCMLKASKLH